MLIDSTSMHNDLTIVIITVTIASLLLVIAFLLFASIIRRFRHNKQYRQLDHLRQFYRDRLVAAMGSGDIAGLIDACRAVPGSIDWQAVEEVLFAVLAEGNYAGDARLLFQRLGYVTFYEERLVQRNVLNKASAIDKLGRMQCPSSTAKLIPLLDHQAPEILSVTVRALSRLGAQEGLLAIVERLPVLLGRSLVTRKAMETALLYFGEAAIPVLLENCAELADPWIMSCILETLSHLPPDSRSALLAAEQLASPNPEVRSKALKVLGRAPAISPEHLAGLVLPLFDDPVWFVRLQAAKTAGALALKPAARQLEKLLFDRDWHVRSETALALTRLGDGVVEVFLGALATDDVYVRENICEELERSGYCDRLIRNLGGDDGLLRSRSLDILKAMHRLGFSTPLRDYVAHGADGLIRQELQSLLSDGTGP
jgi:HEAT repeat protein